MKKILLISFLGLALFNSAQAFPTVTRAYAGTALCWGVFPSDHIDDCYQPTYNNVLDRAQYQADKEKLRKFYDEKIAALEERLKNYRGQLANSRDDITETLKADPQFRRILLKKIEEKNN